MVVSPGPSRPRACTRTTPAPWSSPERRFSCRRRPGRVADGPRSTEGRSRAVSSSAVATGCQSGSRPTSTRAAWQPPATPSSSAPMTVACSSRTTPGTRGPRPPRASHRSERSPSADARAVTELETWLLFALLAVATTGAAYRWARGPSTTEVLVLVDADVALLVSAAALRRLGARITRYDSDEHTLEARTAAQGDGVVRVRARPDGEQITRLLIESDTRGRRRLIRRFRGELARDA